MLGRRESAARAHATQQPRPQIRTIVAPCRKTSLAVIVPRMRRLDAPVAASIHSLDARPAKDGTYPPRGEAVSSTAATR